MALFKLAPLAHNDCGFLRAADEIMNEVRGKTELDIRNYYN